MTAARRYAIGAPAALLLWLVVAWVVAPALVRSAYAGESIALFNGIIRGQSGIPVSRYLSLWSRVASYVTIVLVALGLAGFLLLPLRARLAERLRELTRSLPAPGVAGIAWLAVWTGCAAGLAESVVALIRSSVFHLPTGGVTTIEVVWLTPLAAVTLLLVVGLVLAGSDRLTRAHGAITGLVPIVFVAISTFSLLRRISIGLHSLAVLLLAAGITVQAAHVLLHQAKPAGRAVRRSASVMVVFILSWAVAVPLVVGAREARAVSRLPPAMAGAPNVLLIVWDAARAASLSAWGYERETSPALDRMAGEGVRFTRAIAPAPWTLPTHASLFTGHYPHHTSVGWRDPLDDSHPTLAEVLARNGYTTAGFAGNRHYAGSIFGLDRGFVHYDDRVQIGFGTALYTWWLTRVTVLPFLDFFGEQRSVTRRYASAIQNDFLGWTRRHSGRPWFAFLNLYDAHDPYLAPPPWNRVFSTRRLRTTFEDDRIVYSPEELAELQTSYDACLRYLDAELGRLLARLRADGTLDRTLVIVTSDHGEEFGEHGGDLTRHGRSLYLPALHVPLVMRYPPLGRGLIRSETVTLRDIPATIMDILDPPVGHVFPGRSLVRTRAADDSLPAEPVFATVQRHLQADLWEQWPASAGDVHAVFDGAIHYIRDALGREFLFDIDHDPWEQHNLAGDTAWAATLHRLRRAVDGEFGPAG